MDINGTILKNDLIDIAERAGANFHHAGREQRSACPLHGGNNINAFAVYMDDTGKQRWKCFTGSCGSGDMYDFVMAWQGIDFVGAYRFLGGEQHPDPAKVTAAAHERAEHARVCAEEKANEYLRTLTDLRNAKTWLAYHQQLDQKPDARELWRKRGVPDDWQNFWQLGYCSSFTAGFDGGAWLTPTLTIPVFDPEWNVMNIRHRLLNPPKPNDKYRPERPGLQAAPYIAYPSLGWDTDPIFVVEGEVKSMITFLTMWRKDEPAFQVIGIPGKNQFRGIVDQLQGHDVYICFDPDATQQAAEAARMVKGRYCTFPMKIDDAINAGALDKDGITRLMKMGRKVG
jgi:hypothetical protein